MAEQEKNLKFVFKKDNYWKSFSDLSIDFPFTSKSRTQSKKRKVEAKIQSYGFFKLHNDFRSGMEIFFSAIPMLLLIAELHHKVTVDTKLRKKCEELCATKDVSTTREVYEIPGEKVLDLVPIIDTVMVSARSMLLIPTGFIMQLCSQFDFLVSSIAAEMIRTKPEILNSSDRKIEYSDLYDFDSLQQIKEHFAEKFVESVIRRNTDDQFSWFESVLKIQMKSFDCWPEFVEINERRNLFAHTGGVISTEYLSKCRKAGVKLDKNLKVGDELRVPYDYYSRAVDVFYEVGIKLLQVVWRKLAPDETEQADSALISTGFELLLGERFKLAQSIHEFACASNIRHANENNRNILIINYANNFNLQGNQKEAQKNIG